MIDKKSIIGIMRENYLSMEKSMVDLQLQNDQYYLDEVVQPQYNKDLLVIQANELVRSQQDSLTLLEAKLVRLAIAQILKNDDDFRTYEIDIISLSKLLKIDRYNIYHEMDKLTTDLMRKIIYIRDKESSKKKENYIKLHWVDTVIYKDGIITFKLSNELKPYLLGLQQLFSLYAYEDLIELPTPNSIRLYELLVSYQNMKYRGIHTNQYNGIEIEDGEIVFTLDYLRTFFNCEDSYIDNNSLFVRKVIKSSIDNINKKTVMRVSFRTKRKENKIGYIIFKIKSIGDDIE